jgi:hypothetical protein
MDEFDTGGWEPPGAESHEAWRGSEHNETWPEEAAGPEYWLFRAREEVERVVNELVGEQTASED